MYLFWHYTAAWGNIYTVWTNFLWFVFRFFSIPYLFQTLLAPWERLAEAYPKDFDPAALGETLIVNLLMRLVGIFIRLVIIGVGLVAWLAVFIFGLLFFLTWLILPVLVLLFFIAGFKLIFTP